MDEGQRFSFLYLDRSTKLRDSERFRNKLAAFFAQSLSRDYGTDILGAIQLEIGANVPIGRSGYGYNISEFFKKSEIKDILDSITVIYSTIIKLDSSSIKVAGKWKEFVQRALFEENLGYRLDNKCGVHYFIDEEFERNRFSTLASLENPRYNAS
jgi:hypothetical protein